MYIQSRLPVCMWINACALNVCGLHRNNYYIITCTPPLEGANWCVCLKFHSYLRCSHDRIVLEPQSQACIMYIMHFNAMQNATVGEQYTWALFKAISHMLCIGFGRWPPQNVTEAWLTIISMMVGATFYALFIGNMSTLLLSIDSSGRLYSEKVWPSLNCMFT